MMTLTINGKPVELAEGTRLPDFLTARQIDARHIAVAVNGDVLDRDRYGEVTFRDGDTVEIVRMVGGG